MAGAADPGSVGNLGNPMNVIRGQRPGLVTFAAVMMFLLGGFSAISAIVLFAHATWIAINVQATVGGALWVWGIIDGVFAVAAFYAGYDILQGGETGRILGFIVAGLSALRWFFFIPAAPWAALVIIGVDILTIYALAIHREYFHPTKMPFSR